MFSYESLEETQYVKQIKAELLQLKQAGQSLKTWQVNVKWLSHMVSVHVRSPKKKSDQQLLTKYFIFNVLHLSCVVAYAC